MLLQLQFYLDTPDGHLMGGETILYNSSTFDEAIGRAEYILREHTFPFGKANLCRIRDQDGRLIAEVRLGTSNLHSNQSTTLNS